ncbi:SDR family NAD(P)-dependent oxidoreductase [Marinicrinis sediminis]|uniref:SDR family NAD(P)-dependent oxidoreductase n=1 Tax=Marinicrinis sediminis TaxID=1652465 RepID=A0ABW5RFM1_9BACL
MNLGLAGKLAVVTGSTSGIGKAIAQSLLQEGAKVIINGRTQERVDQTVASLSDHVAEGGEVIGLAGDVGDADSTQSLLAQIDQHGEVDILINNMGIFEVKAFEDIPDEEWMHYMNANVISAVRMSRHYLPNMLERNQGRIVMIASEAGVKPLPQMIPYSVTKTALITLARGLAERTKGTKVTVNSVLPGPTWTEGVEGYMKGAAAAENQSLEPFTESYFRNNEPTSLIQRFATVEEVADTVSFLVSDRASAINGHAQRVEGGIIRSIL